MDSLRWRRHRGLVAVAGIGFLVLTVGFGDARITAITSSERGQPEAFVRYDIQGLVDLFDDGIVHEIAVTVDQDEFDRLVATFQDEGAKESIEASVTIDGTLVGSVGLRLKGNSSLMQLRRDGQVVDRDRLPWLLRFDEYVRGQRYQGLEQIAIRSMGATETRLNEALALSLIAAAGQPSQRASYSSFAVNDEAAALRLVVEVPGDTYVAEHFDADGVLYKALSTGEFVYLGDDPLAYGAAFEQVTRRNRQDLKPLIDLLRWVSESSDEAFAADLDDHVDVVSLARYVALHELVRNFDDMGGPGQNYYLWYDLERGRFTVVTWDLNLAFDRQFGRDTPGNALKDRFLATPAFRAIYDRAYAELHDALYGDGWAIAELERLGALIHGSDLVDAATVEAEVAFLRSAIEAQVASGSDRRAR